MSTDWIALEAAVHGWVVAGSGLTAVQVIWTGQPDAARPPEPAVMLKWYVFDNVGLPWVDTVDNPLTFTPLVIESVAANDLTITAHGLLSGDGPVQLTTTGTLPAPLEEDTDYWVIRVDDDTIEFAATFTHTGGNVVGNPVTPITLTDAGTGVHTIAHTTDTVRAGAEILSVARGEMRMGLQLFCHTSTAVDMNSAMAILRRVADRAYLPSQQARLRAANIGLLHIEHVRPLVGDKDAVMFQPRAWVDVMMSTTFEESENGGIIERVTGDWTVPPDGTPIPYEIPDP